MHVPGAGPKELENLMAKNVNRLVACSVAGEDESVSVLFFVEIKRPGCANCWLENSVRKCIGSSSCIHTNTLSLMLSYGSPRAVQLRHDID